MVIKMVNVIVLCVRLRRNMTNMESTGCTVKCDP